jgi:tetratricopeptide (TPR) repeat protein
MHSGLANCYSHTGERAKAAAEFKIAIEIRERVFGPDSPILIPTLNNSAEMLAEGGDLEQALAFATRAKQLVDRAFGRSNPYYPTVVATYGEVLLAMKRYDDARAAFDDALAVAEKSKHPVLGVVLADRAKLARAENQWPESAGYDERAIAALEASAGKTAVDLYKPLTGLALARLHDHKPADAKPLLERALAVATGKVPDTALTETRESLARAN